jgi:succinate dehydrogenase/fumarate reductase flavoprotein subunit
MEVRGTVVEADVLVLGGGLAGCNAAIGAAEEGARVVLFDKARVKYSGDGGLGIDDHTVVHWDPSISPQSPADYVKGAYRIDRGFVDPRIYRVFALENYNTITRLEGYGVAFRDEKGQFNFMSGTRSGGIWLKDSSRLKPCLYYAARNAGVKLLETTVGTNLLTHNGRVAGAMGIDIRTGEFVVCKAKAVILSTGDPQRRLDPVFSYLCPSNTGDGHAMAYRAGAELVNMEFITFSVQAKNLRLLSSIGNVVHLLGHEALVNWRGERFTEGGEKLRGSVGGVTWMWQVVKEKMEGRGPVFIDIRNISDAEMEIVKAHNESEGRYAIRRWMEELGVDYGSSLIEVDVVETRLDTRRAGVLTDEHAASSIPGLYAVGEVMAGGAPAGRGAAMHAMTFGYHAGGHAARYAASAPEPRPEGAQIEQEKARVCGFLERKGNLGAKEISQVVSKIVEDYGGLFTRSEGNLVMGLEYLKRLREKFSSASAANLHELMRLLGLYNQIQLSEANFVSALTRTESRFKPSHYRIDYPQENDTEWLGKVVIVKRGDKGPEVEVKAPRYPRAEDILAEMSAGRS